MSVYLGAERPASHTFNDLSIQSESFVHLQTFSGEEEGKTLHQHVKHHVPQYVLEPEHPLADITMAHASAAHFAHLRRLALTREVQQVAIKFVKYGSAAYFFRAYVMGVTAVNNSFILHCPSNDLRPPMNFCVVSAVHRTEHVSHFEHQGRHSITAVFSAGCQHQRRLDFA